MTPDRAVELIANRLGNRGSSLNAQIIVELQTAQIDLEQRPELPWFLLNYADTLTMTVSTASSAVPSDFLMEDDYGGIFGIDTGDSSATKRVVKKDFDTLQGRKTAFFSTNNFPEFYALQNASFYWYPTPDAAYTYALWYYRQDPTTIVAAGATNLWLTNAPDVLYNLAGWNIARYLRFPEAVPFFEADFKVAFAQMMAKTEARRQAAFPLDMGG